MMKLVSLILLVASVVGEMPWFVDNITGLAVDPGTGTGFAFPFYPPKDPKYWANPTTHQGISTQLGKIGLACAQNTPTKVGGYSNTVVNYYSPGRFQWLTNRVPLLGSPQTTTSGFPSSTNQVDGGVGGAFHDEMILMMRNRTKLASIYMVSKTHSEDHYQSSSLGGILTTFKLAGNFIGTLQSGERVDPGHIGNLVSDALKGLTDTASNNWSTHKEDVLVGMVPGKNGAQALAGVYYIYDASVKDYKNKKKTTHSSYYSVDNWSVVFTSPDVFKYVFNQFIKS